ncbi:hypothetical protein [Lentiprolixibacter aurantiacus]|uniref:Lipocalin-like domain-containing protein n=1 Tax=Lentiprolixibacter aurantiacus TaxID=2993939 RepID=A0AAE3MJI7_9FLAO|nr:hypothetical protein [Lentiprolixibacter aurantiacus]MCX2718014.1 hypothetical protein [Lentiprolixibacter aurantiacus]
MMRQFNYILVLGAVIVLSCYGCGNNKNAHIGAWEMVYFRSVYRNDTTEMKSNGTPLGITLLTPTHFSYQWKDSPDGAAGTYTYDGKVIHQKFEYLEVPTFVGARLSFNMEVRNDSIIFSGPVKAVSAIGSDIMDMVPQLYEIRRRVK